MDAIPPDQHHPFPDLDVHHDSHTDAEEALEAIRVAIGQSNDFDSESLHDDVNHHVDNLDASTGILTNDSHSAPATTSLLPQLVKHDNHDSSAIDPTLANQTESVNTPTLISGVQIQSAVFEKGLKAIIDLGFSNEVLLDSIKNQEHVDTVKTIVEDVKKKSEIAKTLLTQVQTHESDCKASGPSLEKTCYMLTNA